MQGRKPELVLLQVRVGASIQQRGGDADITVSLCYPMQGGCAEISLGRRVGASLQQHSDGRQSDLPPDREMQRRIAMLAACVQISTRVQQRFEYPRILADRGRMMQRSGLVFGTGHRVRAANQAVAHLRCRRLVKELGRIPVGTNSRQRQDGGRSLRYARS